MNKSRTKQVAFEFAFVNTSVSLGSERSASFWSIVHSYLCRVDVKYTTCVCYFCLCPSLNEQSRDICRSIQWQAKLSMSKWPTRTQLLLLLLLTTTTTTGEFHHPSNHHQTYFYRRKNTPADTKAGGFMDAWRYRYTKSSGSLLGQRPCYRRYDIIINLIHRKFGSNHYHTAV